METKKTQKADLQNKKGFFFEIGLALALIVMLVAFNWKTEAKKETVLDLGPQVVIEEENVPVTQEEQPKPQELPQVMPQVMDQIEIGSNDLDIEMDLSAFNAEDNKLGVEAMDYVEEKEVKEEEEKDEVIPFAVVEEKPSFQGGDANKFPAWVQSKITYPEAAQQNNISGTVYVAFTIMADGSLANVRVVRKVDPLLDAEAIKGVKMSPKWKPGKQRNRAVPVSYQIPVRFVLQ